MAAGRIIIPGWMPAVDSDGVPIPNARMFFYENETTTLATIYADSTLTTPLTNPVPADSSGQFPPIWADDANLFSVTVDAPYGPPGQPFTFDDLGPSTSTNSSAINKADTDGANISIQNAPTFRRALKQDFLTPEDFNAVGDGVADDTEAFRSMLEAALEGSLIQGVAGKSYVITDTILIDKPTNWDGNGAKIRYEWRTEQGGPGFCRPMLVFLPSAAGSRFVNFNLDHDAQDCPGATLAPAPGPGGNDGLAIAWQCALIVQADDVEIAGCRIDNGWDNAFAIGQFTVSGDGTVGNPYILPYSSIVVASPKRVSFTECRAVKAGSGKHYYPSAILHGDYEYVGVGFNNLNGEFASMTRCVAVQCRTGFVSDYGAGASTFYTDCVAYNSLRDTHNSNNGAGWGFWIADGPNSLSNCQALYCQREGFVIPPEANGVTMAGCYAYANQHDGFLIASDRVTMTGCIGQANGLGLVAGKEANFRLNSAVEALTAVVMIGCLSITNGVTKYGLQAQGANLIAASWMGGNLQGEVAAADIGAYGVSIFDQSQLNRNWGIGVTDARSRLEINAPSSSWKVIGVGDTGNEGALSISLPSNRNRKLAMGFDNPNDVGVIQALEAGVSVKRLLLNPSGGGLMTAHGSAPVAGYGAGSNLNGLIVERSDNRNKKVVLGYVNEDYGVLQALDDGTSAKPLWLNPSGASVGMGCGTWDKPFILVGAGGSNAYLFIDSAGRLRIKTASAPGSATDGVIVGTQS